MDDDVPAPGPRTALVLQHRQQQQVLEPHDRQIRSPRDVVERAGCERRRALRHLQVALHVLRLRRLGFRALVVLDVDSDDPAAFQDEGRIEGAEAAQVRRVEPAGRMDEADILHGTGGVRPPAGDEFVAVDVAEEVERKRRRPQQVGPETLVVEALAWLDL